MTFAEVVPDTRSLLPRDSYTYEVPEELDEAVALGSRVEIPFGKRSIMGYVVARGDAATRDDVRAIESVIDPEPFLSSQHVALSRWIADRYCAPLNEVIRAMVPKGARARPSRRARGPRTTSRAVAEAILRIVSERVR